MTRAVRRKVLRWLLVVPAGLGAFWATLFFGMAVHSVVGEPVGSEPSPRRLFIPDELLFPALAAVAAVAVVAACVAAAPSHRPWVGWAAWIVGSVIAAPLLFENDALSIALATSAIVAGAIASALLQMYTRTLRVAEPRRAEPSDAGRGRA